MDEEVLATLEDMLFREQVLCEGKKVDALKAAITALSAPPEPKAEPGTGATHNHGDPMIDGWKAYATSSAHPPAPPEGWLISCTDGHKFCTREKSIADYCEESTDNVVTPLYARPPAPPEGWVMVPREPTKDMLYVGVKSRNSGRGVSDIYTAMIAAAPPAPETP